MKQAGYHCIDSIRSIFYSRIQAGVTAWDKMNEKIENHNMALSCDFKNVALNICDTKYQTLTYKMYWTPVHGESLFRGQQTAEIVHGNGIATENSAIFLCKNAE